MEDLTRPYLLRVDLGDESSDLGRGVGGRDVQCGDMLLQVCGVLRCCFFPPKKYYISRMQKYNE